MKLSVSNWCVQRSLRAGLSTNRDFIDLCASLGADAELVYMLFADRAEKEDVRAYMRGKGVKAACFSGGNDFVSADPAEREAAAEKVKEAIDDAVFFESGLCRVFSGNVKEGISYEQGRDWIIEGFRKVMPYAEEKKVTLVLENHGLFAGKSDQIRHIIESVGSDYLRAVTDTGNFMLVNEDPFEAVQKVNEYVAHVHFKDFIEVQSGTYTSVNGTQYNGTVIGEGEVPLKEIIGFLSKKKFEGYISLEYEGDGEDVYEETKQSFLRLKEMIQ
jgi:AP endonuclease, family 2